MADIDLHKCQHLFKSLQSLRNYLLCHALLYVQVPLAQVVGPVHPVPPHCPQSGAPVPVELVVLGFAEVVVLSFELELIVVISVVDVFEVFEVAGVEVLDVPAAVDDLPGRVETEVPEPDIVPVNLISLEPAPTYTLNVPLGIIRFWEPVSQ